jgi:ankyrin repeat protein
MSLKDSRIDPSAENNWAIRYAAAKGKLEVVKYLMSLKDSRIDPAANNNYAIQYAAARGHLEVVKYLMSLEDSRIDVEILRNYFNVDGIKDLYEQHNKRKRVRR